MSHFLSKQKDNPTRELHWSSDLGHRTKIAPFDNSKTHSNAGHFFTPQALESEFDRFGAIQKVEHRKGDPHAFVWYETLEAAQAAVAEMRGFPLGGPDRRIRIDYSDIEPGNQVRRKFRIISV